VVSVQFLVHFLDLEHDATIELGDGTVTAGTKAYAHHRIGLAPVPLRFRCVQVQAGEQFAPPRERQIHGIQEEAFAEAAGT